MTSDVARWVVAGVTPQQPDSVVRQAARYARHFGAVLVCAHVDPASYVVQEFADGSVDSRPIDPDGPDWNRTVFDGQLAGSIRALAEEEEVELEFRELAGEVAHALGRLAEALDAEMIVVGTRRRGMGPTIHNFFSGSVAAHLAHRQHRPVVVIPLSPTAAGHRLPWEGLGP
jgi:nucleotide-binding universal stress UspA family protein